MSDRKKICPNCYAHLDEYDTHCDCGFNFRLSRVLQPDELNNVETRKQDEVWLKGVLDTDRKLEGDNLILEANPGMKERTRVIIICAQILFCAGLIIFIWTVPKFRVAYFAYTGIMVVVIVFLIRQIFRRRMEKRLLSQVRGE
jgi:Flp pilus assembly protein TadB